MDKLLLLVALPFIGAFFTLIFSKTSQRFVTNFALFFVYLTTYMLFYRGLNPIRPLTAELPWIPQLNIYFSFNLTDVSSFFLILISGIAAIVFTYAAWYLKERQSTFFIYFLTFLGAMLGTVLSDHLITLFLFWEMTSLFSFLLIGFNNDTEEGRFGARLSLITTGLSALAMFVGFMILAGVYDSYSIQTILSIGASPLLEKGGVGVLAVILVMLGAFGKSAQFPLHFWLPRAMSAPTPVSAFLHSAAMVKLGIFIFATFSPLFNAFSVWVWSLIIMGSITMVLGILAAFFSHYVKTVLAYTTVSKLGFLTLVYGLSSLSGQTGYEYWHILNHSLYKAALFMFAGLMIKLASTKDMREMVFKRKPFLGLGIAIASLTMAGFPGTTGFISKEIVLKQLLGLHDQYPLLIWATMAVVVTGTFSVVIAWRFLVLSKQMITAKEKESRSLSDAPLVLPLLILVLGLFPAIVKPYLSELYALSGLGYDLKLLKPWHGVNTAFYLTLSTLVGGTLIYALKSFWIKGALPKLAQLEFVMDASLDYIIKKGDLIFRGLQFHNPFAFVPITLTVFVLFSAYALSLVPALPFELIIYPVETTIILSSILILAVLMVVIRSLVRQVILVSLIGLLVSLLFLNWKAPDLAITQLLVDILGLLLLVILFKVLKRFKQDPEEVTLKWNSYKVLLSLAVGATIYKLQQLFNDIESVTKFGTDIIKLSYPYAGGTNAVNTILVDFRGFDTFGEILVLFISILGIVSVFNLRKKQS